MTQNKEKQNSGIDRSQAFPYYKLQVWNKKTEEWEDIKENFELRDDLIDYAFSQLDWNSKTRMVTVKSENKQWIDPDFDAFGEPR